MSSNKTSHLQIHPAADLFPLMTEEEFRGLKKDIQAHGLREAIVLWGPTGEILDGRNRYRACCELKQPLRTVSLEPDIIGDPFAYVLSVNLHRRHLTAEQKRSVIATVLKKNPKQSNRHVAEQVKVDDKTVATVRRELESTAEIPQLGKTTGKDGKERPASHPTPAVAKTEPEPEPEAQPNREILGVGVFRANEAVDCLKRIPKNDRLRKRGFQIVMDWIEHNMPGCDGTAGKFAGSVPEATRKEILKRTRRIKKELKKSMAAMSTTGIAFEVAQIEQAIQGLPLHKETPDADDQSPGTD